MVLNHDDDRGQDLVPEAIPVVPRLHVSGDGGGRAADQMRNLEEGRILYLPGQSGDQVFLIKASVVKLSRLLPDGRELTLALLGPGDLFGELEAIGGEPRDTQAVVYRPVVLCVIHEQDLVRWMARKPDLALRVTKWIGFRLQVLTNRLQDLLFRSAAKRVARCCSIWVVGLGVRAMKE